MTSVDAKQVVEVVEAGSPAFEQVLALWKRNRSTLGFLPAGAFEDCASEGGLLRVRADDVTSGYAAYRVSGSEAVVVHVCVDEGFRGQGVADSLLAAVFRSTAELDAVRITCRKDYEAATKLWQRHGFRCVGERPGRGARRNRLLVWRRANADAEPLLSRVREEERLARRTVVVDANVFMDFYARGQRASESKALLADWLASEIAICVTAELPNEIIRQDDESVREKRRSQMRRFDLLEAHPDALVAMVKQLGEILPAPRSRSDESDRRQLAHAVCRGAEFFVTRDSTLLGHAHGVEEHMGVVVLRPVDLVGRLYGDQDASAYAPARLAGTEVTERTVGSEADLRRFQAFAASESRSSFLALARKVLADPTRFETKVLETPDLGPVLLVSRDRSAGGRTVSMLRALSSPLTTTLLRATLAELISDCATVAGVDVVCEDVVDRRVREAATVLGFRSTDRGLVKTAVRQVARHDNLPDSVRRSVVGCVPDAASLERDFWPVKVLDAQIPSYLVPIQPTWAAQLFDVELARRELFPPTASLGLALENVYYSGSAVTIPRGARILWYVSGSGRQRVGEVRGASICDGTVKGPATRLFRKFRRLGAFTWRQVLERAGSDPHASLTAYRFSFTECFSSPVSWDRLQGILQDATGRGNPVAGPQPVPEEVFARVYAEGTGERR